MFTVFCKGGAQFCPNISVVTELLSDLANAVGVMIVKTFPIVMLILSVFLALAFIILLQSFSELGFSQGELQTYLNC